MPEDLQNKEATNVEETVNQEKDTNKEGEIKDAEDSANDKKFSQDELNAIIAKEKSKWEKKAEADKEEAKKLAKMNAEEKAKYEADKKEADLAKREAEIVRRELVATAKDILVERGLSTDLHSLLNYESAETVNDSIKTLEKVIQSAVEKQVEERLKGNPPKKKTEESEPLKSWDKVAAKYNKK